MFDALAASPNAHPTEPVPILPEVNDEMNDFVQRLALLQVDARAGLAEMQDAAAAEVRRLHRDSSRQRAVAQRVR